MTTKIIRRSRCKRALLSLLALVLSFLIAGCDPLTMLVGSRFIGSMASTGADHSGLAIIDHSRVSVERLMVEEAFCRTVRQYLTACLATERAARLDQNRFSKQEAIQIIQKAAAEWKCFSELLERTKRMAEILERNEQNKRFSLMLEHSFFSRAYAEGKITAEEGSVEWAKQVQDAYDSFPAGKKINELTKELGKTNPKEAHDKLQKAGEILDKESNWDIAKSTAKGAGKGAAVVAGLAVVAATPVGVAAAAGALSTGLTTGTVAGVALGTAAAGIGMVATVSGTVAAGTHLGEDISGKKLEGDAAKFRDTVDNIALVSGTANILVSGGKAVSQAVKNAGEGATKTQIAKETAKEFFGNSSVPDELRRPVIATAIYDTVNTGKDVVKAGVGLITKTTDDGKTALTPVETKEDTPPAEVKPIEKLTDEELITATENYEADGTPEEKTERVEKLEKMQKQPKDKDDWIHWNANGINKAENDRIMREEPNDIRDHVAQRLENYKNSEGYKEELKKRDEVQKELGPTDTPTHGIFDAEGGKEQKKPVEDKNASGTVSGKADTDKRNDSGTVSGDVSGKADRDRKNDSGTVSGKADTDKKNDSGKADTGKESGQADTGKDSGTVSGGPDAPPNDADAPYAIPKVIGATYGFSTVVEGRSIWARYRVVSAGDWIAIACSTSETGSFIANVTSYDPQTGVGVAVAQGEPATFYIRGTPGAMSLSFDE